MQFWHRLERIRSLLLRVRAWSVSSWPPPRQTHYWGSKDDGRVPFSPALGAQNGLPDNLRPPVLPPKRSGPALRGVGSWILQPAMEWAPLLGCDPVRPDNFFLHQKKNILPPETMSSSAKPDIYFVPLNFTNYLFSSVTRFNPNFVWCGSGFVPVVTYPTGGESRE